MVNLVVWLVVGIIAGWLATRVGKPAVRPGGAVAVVCGILGAMLGGLIYDLSSQASIFNGDFSVPGLVAAIAGAVVLLAIVYLLGLIGQSTAGRRILAVIGLALTVIMLVLVLAGVAGTWYARSVATDASVKLLTATADFAARGQAALARLDASLAAARTLTTQVGQAAVQAGQNVADKGFVEGLLPAERATQVQDTGQRVQDGVQAVSDMVDAAAAFWVSLDNLPFVTMPKPKPTTIAAIRSTGDAVSQGMQTMASNVQDLRAGAADRGAAIGQTATQVDARLGEAQTNVASLNADLAAVEARANELKVQVPQILLIAALVLTLLETWLAYALALTLQHFWRALRRPQVEDAMAPAPVLPA